MITFKSLEKADLPLLHSWLNQLHMRDFYQKKPISLDKVIKKYTLRIEGDTPTYSHIAYYQNQPIGMIQSYKTCDYPEWRSEMGVLDGIGLDLFIGEPEFLGKGLGRKMLGSYLIDVVLKAFEDESNCYICHEIENVSAIACSESVGFVYVKDVIEDGKPSKLFRYSR